jgi:acyl-coenzyme A thioesterase PaaI-like protein
MASYAKLRSSIIMNEKMFWNATKRNNPFMEYNHIEIINVETDHAVLKLEIQPESRNLWGTLHGGAMCAMADNAAGIALSTDGRIYVTQNEASGIIVDAK